MATIFLAGVYGVGKSTLGEKLSNQANIPYYSAGDLISKVNGEKYGANKLVVDKGKNQEILAECVAEILKKTGTIMLAGHFCIVNSQGWAERLPQNVYDQLHLQKIILLEADPHTVMTHLSGRDGKEYPLELIKNLIKQERQAAHETANRLNCPLIIHQMYYSEADITKLILEI